MSIIVWAILGLIAGVIASKIVNKQDEGLLLEMVLGIIGALIGGFIFNAAGAAGITGFNAWSFLAAIVGAIIVLIFYHALIRRRSY